MRRSVGPFARQRAGWSDAWIAVRPAGWLADDGLDTAALLAAGASPDRQLECQTHTRTRKELEGMNENVRSPYQEDKVKWHRVAQR